jgi:hypothetical protein
MRYIPFVIQIGLMIYALIDCVQTDSVVVRNLPKPLWIFLIVLVPVVGPIVWLVAGRPQGTSGSQVPWPATRTAGFPEYERPRAPRGPDDDARFLAGVDGPDPEKEELLRQWEEQLRSREAQMRAEEHPPAEPEEPGAPGGRA